MTLNTLAYMIALSEELNFSNAARRLFITQQTLSAHIATVEQELGCQLLTRSHPLKLTAAGEVFVSYARSIQGQLDAMQQDISDIAQNKKGNLRVGVTFSRSITFMPDTIVRFQRKYPDIKIIIYEDLDMLERLHKGELDLVLTSSLDKFPNLTLAPFYTEKTHMIVSRRLLADCGIREEDVRESLFHNNLNAMAACPFILNEKSGKTKQIILELLANSDFTPIQKCEIVDSKTILALCVRHAGAGFIPKSVYTGTLTKPEYDSLLFFELPEKYDYAVYFAYMTRGHVWSVLRDFMDEARSVYCGFINRAPLS